MHRMFLVYIIHVYWVIFNGLGFNSGNNTVNITGNNIYSRASRKKIRNFKFDYDHINKM